MRYQRLWDDNGNPTDNLKPISDLVKKEMESVIRICQDLNIHPFDLEKVICSEAGLKLSFYNAMRQHERVNKKL